MTFDLQLTDRRVFVTGGTKGVGAAVVKTLRDAGARVAATARSVPAGARPDVHYVAADLATAEGATAVANAVLEQFGGIDIVVSVLGGSSAPAGGFAALDDGEWSKEISQNLVPAVRLDRALLPSMLAQGRASSQQGPLQGGGSERRSRGSRCARMDRNGGSGRPGRAARSTSRQQL